MGRTEPTYVADSQENLNTSDEAILKTALERFKLAKEAWKDIYAAAEDDLKFIAGDQWPEEIKSRRDREKRPCLTINRLATTVNQVVNDGRQNRPAIRVSPVDDRADIETAKIRQGIIRHIERNSNAALAYDTAFENAVRASIGFFALRTDYENATSFNLEARFRQLPNIFNVYLDPFFQEPDGSDANWGFIFEDVQHDDYKTKHPESELGKSLNWENDFSHADDWVKSESCRVAEYYTKDYTDAEIYLLNTGDVVLEEQLLELLPLGYQVINKRKTKIPVINWYTINGAEILERTEIPGKFIPIIPVLGNKLIVEGKLILESLIRHAKDPQKALNFSISAETEAISLAPKAPFIVAEGQIPQKYQPMWKTANTNTHPYLVYKPTDHEGTLLPPPQRNTFEPAVAAITNSRMQASEDIKQTTGLFDASLGARSNETSGKAIEGRQRQAQTTNFHFTDNLNRSIHHAGRILNDWIPVLYDTPRAVRMIGEEENEEVISILDETFKYKGEPKRIDFSVGKYDVSVDAGPSYATKRQEAAATMLELSAKNPQIMQIAPDIVVNNLDVPGGKELADRLKKTVDPKLIESKDQAPIPPHVQAQMTQMTQLVDDLTAQLNKQNELVNTKKMEIESRERIEAMKIEAQLVLEQMKQQGAAANAVFEAELASINQRLSLLDINQPINSNFENDFNESGSDQAVIQEQQQPTGGATPGTSMEF